MRIMLEIILKFDGLVKSPKKASFQILGLIISGTSGTLLAELTDFNLFVPKLSFISNFDQHYDF